MKRICILFQYAGHSLVGIGLFFQLLAIILAWWDFDPRTTCDRLPGWGEWISCLHGSTHLHVWLIELSVVAWLLAGSALALGRRFPGYVSALLPLTMVGFFAFGTSLYWRNHIVPYMIFGEATREQLVSFALTEGLVLIFFFFPVFGGWLVGLRGRRQRP